MSGPRCQLEVIPSRVAGSPGETVAVEIRAANPGPSPVVARLSWVGIEDQLVRGLRLIEIGAGASVSFTHRLTVPLGTNPAARSLAVELTDAGGERVLAGVVLDVPEPSRLQVWAEPANPQGRWRAKTRVHLLQPGNEPVTVALVAEAVCRSDARSRVRVRLRRRDVVVAGSRATVVRARLSGRPHLGKDRRGTLVQLRASGAGAPVTTLMTFNQTGFVPAPARRVGALVAVVGLWAGLVAGGLQVARRLSPAPTPAPGQEQAPPEVLARTDPADEVPDQQR